MFMYVAMRPFSIFLLFIFTVYISFCQKIDSLLLNYTKESNLWISEEVLYALYHFEENEIFNSNQHLNYISFPKKHTKYLEIGLSKDTINTTSLIALSNNALAAINGSFFNVKTGMSVNFIRKNGEIIDTTFIGEKGHGPHQNAAIAFNDTSFVIMSREEVQFGKWEESLPYLNVMESGPLLIKNYQKISLADNPFNINRHPRTCVCVTEDNIIWLTADGRNSLAHGLSLDEVSEILLSLGCKDAINLDGGGSTTMFIKNSGIVNRPSDNNTWDTLGERPVSNVLMLVKK